MINLGRQWVLGDAITIDIYYGIGYGIDNANDFFDDIHYGMSTFGDGVGPAVSAGFSIGIPFGGKKK